MPAEMMKDFPPQSSTAVLEAPKQPRNCPSITHTISNTDGNLNQPERPQQRDRSEQEDSLEGLPPRPWFAKRIWNAFRQWEQEHLELVLENKQSVARDHLGVIPHWRT